MAITASSTVRADDFIDEAEKDATPSNDEGRVAKLEADAKIHPYFTRMGKEMNCGETIAGATTPVPVYQNKTDNELYSCDANDTDKLKFLGFVTSAGTDGNPARFQGNGVVGGFSALSEGEKYYVQDTVGTIGTTSGTYTILVGVAISTTELLIMKGMHRMTGVLDITTTTAETVTTGFRPSKITVYAVNSLTDPSSVLSHSIGVYVNGASKCLMHTTDNGGSNYGGGEDYTSIYRVNINSNVSAGSITAVTDTGFTIGSITSNIDMVLLWEAEGEY